MIFENGDFYVDGEFQVEKARDAYFGMMEGFNYPVPPAVKEGMWATDFSLGDFVNVGMAGIFWCNDEEHKYFGHEIFLLPGQMIVEHGHAKLPETAAKMEAWHVRHGRIYSLGEGEPTDPMPIRLPESQAEFISVKNCKLVSPGEVDYLKRPEAKHFMVGGPEGAIVTEYATFHTNDALRFTNPGVAF